MALTEKKWLDIKGYYEAGLSLGEIARRTKVNKSTISRKIKGNDWVSGKNLDYIEAKGLIATEKATLDEEKQHSLHIADEVSDERTKHLLFFNRSALKNQHFTNKKMDDKTDLEGLERHSRITSRNKETVLGKESTTQINNNNQQNNQHNKIEIVLDE